MMRKLSVLLLALFVVIGCLPFGIHGNANAAEKVHKWKLQGFTPDSEPELSVSGKKFAEMVAENTNGQVQITIFPVGAITGAKELLDATRDGVLEMSMWSCGYGVGAIPLLGVIDGLPFSWRNSRELAEVLWDFGLSDLSRAAYEKYGVHLLGHYTQSTCGLGMVSKKEIKTLEDLQGLKLRTHGIFLKFWKKIGAATVTMPISEVYTALATNVVDAATMDWSSHGFLFKHAEIAKFGVLPSMIGSTGGHMVVNKRAWNALPEDTRKIITLTWWKWAAWHERYFHPYLRYSHERAINELKNDFGVKFTTLSESDQEKMLQVAISIWDEIAAADPLAAKGVAIVKDYYKKKGRLK